MNARIRNSMLGFGFALSISACRQEAKPTADVLAQDSLLNLAVLSANQDTTGDTAASLAPATAAPAGPSGGSPSQPATITTSIAAPTTTTAPVRSLSNPAPVTARRAARRVTPPATRHVRLASAVQPARTSRRRATVASYPGAPRRTRPSATKQPNSPIAASPAPAEVSDEVVSPRRSSARTSNVVPVGSSLALTSDREVCNSSSKVGQSFGVSLAKDVTGPDGVMLPEGTKATAQIASVSKDDPGLGIRIASLTFGGRTYPVSSETVYTQVDRVQTSSHGSAAKIAVGAGMGALLGRVLGGNAKSTVIGAVGGAAAGGVIANTRTTGYARCIPSGGQILARLTEPLRVPLSD